MSTIITSQMDDALRNLKLHGFHVSSIGEISIAKYTAENQQIIARRANQSIKKSSNSSMKIYLSIPKQNLLFSKQNHYILPMILSGDFNVEFFENNIRFGYVE